ncbi:hypothetical protein EYF80_047953 [Liparis tanakae]|uniref:Uncharacterized protein n=1 Tax=Liparis tanakae TaxID=230148 RepID=A0A4Z2FKV6_9TELE|nr:hypothetical protein EYF80_047953 [Liparis tanakae]
MPFTCSYSSDSSCLICGHEGSRSVASAPRDRAVQTARVRWEHRGPHLVPFGLERGVSERLAVLVDLLNDALVVHHGGVVVPQQRVLPTLLGVVAYLCQVHAEYELEEEEAPLSMSTPTWGWRGSPSALTRPRFPPSLVPQTPAAAALARLLQPQRLVALQSVRQSQKDGVHVLLLSGFLGRGLEQREVVAVGEALRRGGGDLPAVLQVALVAHHDARHQGPHAVPAALLDPLGDALEGGEAGHVVHEDDGVDAAVVVLHHALPEALLTRCVPDLQLSCSAALSPGTACTHLDVRGAPGPAADPSEPHRSAGRFKYASVRVCVFDVMHVARASGGAPSHTLMLSPSSSSVRSRKSTPIVASGFFRKVPPQNRYVRHVFPTFESPMTMILNTRAGAASCSRREEDSRESLWPKTFSSENELELPESESASVNSSKSQSALEPLSSSSSVEKLCAEPRHAGYTRVDTHTGPSVDTYTAMMFFQASRAGSYSWIRTRFLLCCSSVCVSSSSLPLCWITW